MTSKFLYGFVVAWGAWGAVSYGMDTDNNQPALAIIVQSEQIGGDLADSLQPLLEAEAALQWIGSIVERARLDIVLDELKISASGLAEPECLIQLGKMIKMDCLLTANVSAESVRMAVLLFPSTVIVYEKTYRQRLEPYALAVNMVTDAVKALRKHRCDPNMPQVSIGAFYNSDPHRRFFEFSQEVATKLRNQLAADNRILLTERLFPSDLMSEFELARSGFTARIERCLSAPPSDIMLYGEFEAHSEQYLHRRTVMLDHTLFIVSPTGLCENKTVKFSCRSDETEMVVHRALKLIDETVTVVRTKLATGQKRTISDKEYESFKQQAFQCMPNPPHEGVFYRERDYWDPSQTCIPTKYLERALCMLECTMLFKGNDTQVLACMGAVLDGLARTRNASYPEKVKMRFLEASYNLIERAYYLESNSNTRGMYHHFCMATTFSPPDLSPNSIKAARQIWTTRHAEQWKDSRIHDAFRRLLAAEKDYQRQGLMLIESAPLYIKRDNGLRSLYELFYTFQNHLYNDGGNSGMVKQAVKYAEQLQNESLLYLKALGYLLGLEACWIKEEHDNNHENATQFATYLRGAVGMLPELFREYGTKFNISGYSEHFPGLFIKYEILINRYSLEDDIVALKAQYVEAEMQGNNYNHVSRVIMDLLPAMWEQERYEHTCKMLTRVLEHYDRGGAGDHERMYLARQRNRFLYAMEGTSPPLDISAHEVIKFDDNVSGWVTKIIAINDDLFGIRRSEWNSNGRAFRLEGGGRQAETLLSMSDDVQDLAATDKYVVIATGRNGVYVINRNNNEIRHITPDNSNLPDRKVPLVCACMSIIYIGIRDNTNYHTIIYALDPEAEIISSTGTRIMDFYYGQIKPNNLGNNWLIGYASGTPKEIKVIPQNWDQRTACADDSVLHISCRVADNAIKQVVVQTNEKQELMRYRGFELSYIYDFTLWNGTLVFATGNGLYASRPGSNRIHCILSEPDLQIYSLCPLSHHIYIGTSQGLYGITSDAFMQAIDKAMSVSPDTTGI